MSVIVQGEERPEGGRLARLTIDNASKLNSLNRALMAEILEAAGGLAADPQLRLVILSGAGERAFVGGADIGEIAALDRESARGFITAVHRCCDAFRRMPAPVIARIDGYALGAGLELAAACDLRVARPILAAGARAIRLQKSLILDWEELPISAAVQRGIECFVSAFETDEPARMAGAMLAQLRARRRPPR